MAVVVGRPYRCREGIMQDKIFTLVWWNFGIYRTLKKSRLIDCRFDPCHQYLGNALYEYIGCQPPDAVFNSRHAKACSLMVKQDKYVVLLFVPKFFGVMMESYHDPRRRSTIIEIFDKEFSYHREKIFQIATDEVVRVLVKQGLRSLQQRPIIVKRGTHCYIPFNKRKK